MTSDGKPSALASHYYSYNLSDHSHASSAVYPVQLQQHHRDWNNRSSSARGRFDTMSASTATTAATTEEDVQDHDTLDYRQGGQQPHTVTDHSYSRHEYRASSRRGEIGASGGHGADYRQNNPYYQTLSRTAHSPYHDNARSSPYYYPPPPVAANNYPYHHRTSNNSPGVTTQAPLIPTPTHHDTRHRTAGSTRSTFWDDGWDDFRTNDPSSDHQGEGVSVLQSASNNVKHNSHQKRSWSQRDNSSLDESPR